MPFLIETFDAPERSHIRKSVYSQHLRFLSNNSNLLLACGAKLDDSGELASGGIYLVDVDTREDAELFIESDPFHINDLFERVKITRWRMAYLGGECFLTRD